MERQHFIAAFAAVGFTLVFGSSERYPITARCAKSTAPAALKAFFHHGYSSEEQLTESLGRYLKILTDRNTAKEEQKNKKKELRANMVNPFKVGEIFYDSWGYDQTNIDFYQIIEVKSRSVVIREIGGESVPGRSQGVHGDYGYIRPKKDLFCGLPMTKNIQVRCWGGGEPVVYIRARFGGSLSKYEKSDEVGIYHSWGH